MKALPLFLAGMLLALLAASVYLYPWMWAATLLGAGLVYGSLSPLVHSRRLLFMAGAAPHAALAAASLGVVIAGYIGGPYSLWGLLLGTILVYVAGYSTYRGMDPDVSAGLLAGFSASLGVAGLYLAARVGAASFSFIIGDPLLASPRDALIVIGLGAATTLILVAASERISYIGVDRDDALLSGARVWVYDLILFTALAVTTVGFIRLVGFILEHVLILIPGALILLVTRGARVSTINGAMLGGVYSLAGLLLAGLTGLPPAALTGFLLMASYLAVLVRSGLWRGL